MAKRFPTKQTFLPSEVGGQVVGVSHVVLDSSSDYVNFEGTVTDAAAISAGETTVVGVNSTLNFYVSPNSDGLQRIVNVDGGSQGDKVVLLTYHKGTLS